MTDRTNAANAFNRELRIALCAFLTDIGQQAELAAEDFKGDADYNDVRNAEFLRRTTARDVITFVDNYTPQVINPLRVESELAPAVEILRQAENDGLHKVAVRGLRDRIQTALDAVRGVR